MDKSAIDQIADIMIDMDLTDSDKLDAIQTVLDNEGY